MKKYMVKIRAELELEVFAENEDDALEVAYDDNWSDLMGNSRVIDIIEVVE